MFSKEEKKEKFISQLFFEDYTKGLVPFWHRLPDKVKETYSQEADYYLQMPKKDRPACLKDI